MIRKEPQSYEVAEYSDVEFGTNEAFKVIKQIFADIVRDCPAHAIWANMAGDQLQVHYMTYTMHLPSRLPQVEAEAEEVFKQTSSYLKKEFRARTGKFLKLKENRELGSYAIERVSLNARYTYRAWRFYGMDWS